MTAKRIFDALTAVLVLAASSPVLAILMALIAAVDRQNPVFIQERWGRHCGRFRAHKLRTMRGGTPTRLGTLLRRSALDELPQVLNILNGDMSWVGPRAMPVDETCDGVFYDQLSGWLERSSVRPGLTGPTQMACTKDTPMSLRLPHDLAYVRHRSFLGDLRIIAVSVIWSLTTKWDRRAA